VPVVQLAVEELGGGVGIDHVVVGDVYHLNNCAEELFPTVDDDDDADGMCYCMNYYRQLKCPENVVEVVVVVETLVVVVVIM